MTRVVRFGPSVNRARRAVVFLHGRGGSADDMPDLAAAIGLEDVAFVAPEAPGRTWYPLSFLAPIEQNEPWLSGAIATVRSTIDEVRSCGVAGESIALMGFSQGACLALEFAARHAARYAAIVGFSGGLIGPTGTPRTYPGDFDRTPVFLGCSDVDPHIPLARVHETADVLRRLNADVDERIYAGMGHTIERDELNAAIALLRR
jgi:predicted esterase